MVNENAHIRFVLKLLLLFSIHTAKLISFQQPDSFFSLSFFISSHISFSQNFGKHLVGVTSSQKNALLSENAVPDCRYLLQIRLHNVILGFTFLTFPSKMKNVVFYEHQ